MYDLADRLSLTQDKEIHALINDSCKEDKEFAAMLSNYVVDGKLKLNLDVLN